MDVLGVLVRVLAPILSFTTDEVWEHYPEAARNRAGRPCNVQLAGWPSAEGFVPAIPAEEGESAYGRFCTLLEVRESVTKALEQARADKTINKSQEARVALTLPGDLLACVSSFDPSVLEELFIVSGVSIEAGDEVAVRIEPAEGQKCPRCWNYRVLGSNPSHPDVCARCADVLDELASASDACEA